MWSTVSSSRRKERRLVGPRFLLLPRHVHRGENDLMRLLRNYATIRIQMDRLRPVDGHHDRRQQFIVPVLATY
jgi:hypothetical protein